MSGASRGLGRSRSRGVADAFVYSPASMRLATLPGDGIGPEITSATINVVNAVNDRLSLGLTFEMHEIGLASLDNRGTTLTDDVLTACRAADGIILGPVSHAT